MFNIIPKWLKRRVARKVDLIPTKLTIPAFSFAVKSNANDSYMLGQFNFTLENVASVINHPLKPVTPTYTLCVKFRVDDVVTRYYLWESDDVISSANGGLYTGQLLPLNICIEVWSVVGVTPAVNTIDRPFVLSLRRFPESIASWVEADNTTGTSVDITEDLPILTSYDNSNQAWITN